MSEFPQTNFMMFPKEKQLNYLWQYLIKETLLVCVRAHYIEAHLKQVFVLD
jgi:hypothetical protein